MGDSTFHARIAEENAKGALKEYEVKRFVNVGLLAIKAMEQAIEACAAKENLHFHQNPRTAHVNRRNWLEGHYPDLLDSWNELWMAYGALGYEGLDGDRAKMAVNALERSLKHLQHEEGIEFGV
ncbi:MAG: hypothetical protein ACE5OY_02335 [Candidatus Bathyarchaeia archaeon]